MPAAHPFAPWLLNLKAKSLSLFFMDGVLTVCRGLDGRPFAQWEGTIAHPPEFVSLHPEAAAEGVQQSSPRIAVLLHFLPSIAAAADYAPAAVRSAIRANYPHHFARFEADPPPARFVAEDGSAPADPF